MDFINEDIKPILLTLFDYNWNFDRMIIDHQYQVV